MPQRYDQQNFPVKCARHYAQVPLIGAQPFFFPTDHSQLQHRVVSVGHLPQFVTHGYPSDSVFPVWEVFTTHGYCQPQGELIPV